MFLNQLLSQLRNVESRLLGSCNVQALTSATCPFVMYVELSCSQLELGTAVYSRPSIRLLESLVYPGFYMGPVSIQSELLYGNIIIL